MEFGPDARARTPHQQAYRFAAVAESQHEQSRAAILAALRVTHHRDRKSTRLNSSHSQISYAVFCLKKKKTTRPTARSSRTSPPSIGASRCTVVHPAEDLLASSSPSLPPPPTSHPKSSHSCAKLAYH